MKTQKERLEDGAAALHTRLLRARIFLARRAASNTPFNDNSHSDTIMGVQYSCNSWLLHTDNWGNAQNNDDREGRRAEADGGRAPFRPTQFSSPLLVYRAALKGPSQVV